jgi:cyclophilin family peptidyl-prolyl cis-trans isomerase
MAHTFQGKLPDSEITNKVVRITTAKGDIVVELYPDTAPVAVSNFLSLAKSGFYDGVIFHRVIKGFMIQGGDPTGTGRGGPGYQFDDELSDDRTYSRGTLAMANAGDDTNGSQFFIMHQDYPLEHKYTIFGKVISGMEVVDAIAETPTDGNPPMGNDRPLTDQVMTKVTVEDAK